MENWDVWNYVALVIGVVLATLYLLHTWSSFYKLGYQHGLEIGVSRGITRGLNLARKQFEKANANVENRAQAIAKAAFLAAAATLDEPRWQAFIQELRDLRAQSEAQPISTEDA